MYDITVIGAGVAGMTAAIYALRANKKVLILEGRAYGGQILETNQIDNYPARPHISGPVLAKEIYSQLKEFAPDFRYEVVENVEKLGDIFEVTTDLGVYETKSVIIATGTNCKKLNLQNEDLLTGKGISYCATCDGELYRGKKVYVYGGGNTALYSALYLSNIARTVILVHRRNEFRGDSILVDKLKTKANVEFRLSTIIESINPEEGILHSLTLKNVETNELTTERATGLFVEIGREPDNSPFQFIVDCDENGYIIADESGLTSCPGLFAAGDCRTKKLRQIITAGSDGASAASSAIDFLNTR